MTTPILDDSEETLRTHAGLALLGHAQHLRVTDQPSFALAATLRRDAKDEIKWWTEFFRPLKRSADAAKKVLLDKEKEKLAGPQQAVTMLDEMLEAYERQQARAWAIAQARAAEEATRRAAARPTPLPGDDPLPPVVVPAVAVALPTSEEVGFASYWKAEVVDLGALILAVASGQVPATYLMANDKALNEAARSAKAGLNIPGVRPVEDRRARG